MRVHHVAILTLLLCACGGDDLDDASRETSDEVEEVERVELAEADEHASAALLDEGEDESAPDAEVASLAAEEDEVEGASADGADEQGEDELAEALAFNFHECVHDKDGRRPELRRERQRETKRLIEHVTKRLKTSAGFRNLLMLVALREASYQQGLVHQLNADLLSSRAAWRRVSGRYEGNAWADDPEVWQTYGLFGMNSNFFTMLWDKQADPRVLCDAIVDIVVYRRAAIRAVKKLNGDIRCKNSKGEHYTFNGEPTWATIHRAVNGGKLCPSKKVDQASMMRKYFDARARKVGLDPDERVTVKMLGEEPSKAKGRDGEAWETQEEMVEGIWAEFEAAEAELEES